jgi:hypothetical protein
MIMRFAFEILIAERSGPRQKRSVACEGAAQRA